MKKLVAITALLSCFFNTAKCQFIESSRDLTWVDLGLGMYEANTDGFSYGISANLFREHLLYKIRFIHHAEFKLDLLHSITPHEHYNELGAMIGKGFAGKYAHIVLSGGLGYIAGVKRGKLIEVQQGGFILFTQERYEEVNFVAPALPLELDFQFKPVSFLGLGVCVFGNFNSHRSVYGAMAKLAVGSLRGKKQNPFSSNFR